MQLLALHSEWPRFLLQGELSLLAQSSVVLLLGLALTALVRRHGPEMQALACRAALCALLALLPSRMFTTDIVSISSAQLATLLRLV